MKRILLLLLVVSGLSGCEKEYTAPHIRPHTNSLSVLLGTEVWLNVAYDVSWTHVIDDPEILTLRSTEKRPDGTMSMIFEGKKIGRTQIRLMEGVTKYRALYPDREIHSVSCRRCLMYPRRS